MTGTERKGYSKKSEIPFWEKLTLTLEEGAAYSGIGINKFRAMTNEEDCPYVLWVGQRKCIKRKKLEEFLDRAYSV